MTNQAWEDLEIAAIVPCYNEEVAVGQVIKDLREAVPQMTIYVYDNNSSDNTAQVAREAGAIVRHEPRKGKGNVIRRAFADIEADVYLMIDGDDTYDAKAAGTMISTLVDNNLDHVLGCRIDNPSQSAYRKGHAQGNQLFNRLVGKLFGEKVTDMLSGYRVFSKRFVKSFPSLSKEFEIETELTIHSMALRVPQQEIGIGFKDRPDGSESKLRTYHDGFRILSLIARLFAHERPGIFWGSFSALSLVISLILGLPVISFFFQTGTVPRFPTAFLAASLVIIAVLCAMLGIILSGVLRMRREATRLSYLRISNQLQNRHPVKEQG